MSPLTCKQVDLIYLRPLCGDVWWCLKPSFLGYGCLHRKPPLCWCCETPKKKLPMFPVRFSKMRWSWSSGTTCSQEIDILGGLNSKRMICFSYGKHLICLWNPKQPFLFKWMFGETTISQVKVCNHPRKKKHLNSWMFQVLGLSFDIPHLLTTINSKLENCCSLSFLRSFTVPIIQMGNH